MIKSTWGKGGSVSIFLKPGSRELDYEPEITHILEHGISRMETLQVKGILYQRFNPLRLMEGILGKERDLLEQQQ
jgi:hypothetical protein